MVKNQWGDSILYCFMSRSTVVVFFLLDALKDRRIDHKIDSMILIILTPQ